MARFDMYLLESLSSSWRFTRFGSKLGLMLGLLWWGAMGHSAIADDVSPGLGRALDPVELKRLQTHVFADGRGLPSGSGNSRQGAKIYVEHCAGCHGDNGEGARAMELSGDRSLLASAYPDRGIAVYWPYAPTLFEYIKRAMPPEKPGSLSDSEIYAVIARLLEFNGLIQKGQRVDAAFLSSLDMPNKDNFRSKYED